VFRDRADAGRRLAEALGRYRGEQDLVVLALPRGGVPVGFELARGLDAALDVIVVRKLGAPGQAELAIGAIASGGMRVVNDRVVAELGLGEEAVARAATLEERELIRRECLYRGGREPVGVKDRTVIVVDDGLATGATMRDAVLVLRSRHPRRLVVAVPVAPAQSYSALLREVDELVCLATPKPFIAVGAWYDNFSPITDEEVRHLLERPGRPPPP
jgi:putative phosphoribosyl transferase